MYLRTALRRQALAAATLVAIAAAVTCSRSPDAARVRRARPSITQEAPRILVGTIVHIDAQVPLRDFVLSTGNRRWRIEVDPEVHYGFPLAHLRTHWREDIPVKVFIRANAGRLIAIEILDG
jgi:hypothetical protein